MQVYLFGSLCMCNIFQQSLYPQFTSSEEVQTVQEQHTHRCVLVQVLTPPQQQLVNSMSMGLHLILGPQILETQEVRPKGSPEIFTLILLLVHLE